MDHIVSGMKGLNFFEGEGLGCGGFTLGFVAVKTLK
jgi:hypothetical protein